MKRWNSVENALAASEEQVSRLKDSLDHSHRLNYAVERKIDAMPSCYDCHENRKAMRCDAADPNLPYDEGLRVKKRLRTDTQTC